METIDVTSTQTTPTREAERLGRLTVADGLLFLIVAAGIIIRFTGLNALPLSPNEAAEAWSIWQFWQPNGLETIAGSPAYFSLTSLLIPIFGSSDAVMRLVPALFGLALVVLPWFLRQRLGNIGALTASLLLAISPLQALVSRTGGGDSVALFAIMLIIVAWLRYEESTDFRWLPVLFSGLVLGLTSSPLFYGGLITLLLAYSRAGWRQKLAGVASAVWRQSAVISISLFIALSTLFLVNLPGLGAAATLPARWLGQFSLTGIGWADPFSPLLWYEPVMLMGIVTAVLWTLLTDNKLGKRLILWLAGIILLMLFQNEQVNNSALLTLPGALLIGLMADKWLHTRPSLLGWGWAGGLLLLAGLILVNLARYSRVITQSPQDFTSAWVILMAVTTLVVTLYFIGAWDITAVQQGTILALLAFFSFFQWGTGWWLTHEAANDPRARWLVPATDDDVQFLVHELKDISRQATNSDYELGIFSRVDTPVLRWYLRDFNRLEFGASLPVGALHDVIVSSQAAELALGGDYAGADFGLLRLGVLPTETPSLTPGLDKLRWWLFHESALPLEEERVILWWRTNLNNE